MKLHEINVLKDVANLFNKHSILNEDVVLVHDYGYLDSVSTSDLYRWLSEYLNKGTLGVFGNEALNEHVGLNQSLQHLSTQERMVLGSGNLLQLLTLDKECRYASHPAQLIGFKGKYAPYLSRSFDLDFPYGPISIYNDLYGMDAFVIHIGECTHLPELRHALSKRVDAVIQKNTLMQRGEEKSYLDYDVDFHALKEALFRSGLVHRVKLGDVEFYLYRYQEVIDALRLMDL